MHISRRALVLAALIAAMAPGASAASPTQTLTTATETEPAKLAADWTGPTGLGVNLSYFLDGLLTTGSCGDVAEPQAACDKTLVHVKGVVGDGSSVKFRIDGFLPISDFDIRVYTADADGNLDTYLGSPSSTDVSESSPLGSSDPRYTSIGDYENKLVDLSPYADYETGAIDQWFAVVVPYFLVVNDKYDGHATLDAKPFVPPTE